MAHIYRSASNMRLIIGLEKITVVVGDMRTCFLLICLLLARLICRGCLWPGSANKDDCVAALWRSVAALSMRWTGDGLNPHV